MGITYVIQHRKFVFVPTALAINVVKSLSKSANKLNIENSDTRFYIHISISTSMNCIIVIR